MTQSTIEIKLLPVSKTDGRHIEILHPVSILTMCIHQNVILRQSAKFRLNQTIGGGVMTSYRFFKMAAIKLEGYFRV